MVDEVNKANKLSNIGGAKSKQKQVPTEIEIREAAVSHIIDRLGNVANRLVSGIETKDTVLNDLRIFINAWSDPKTEFYFYRDDFAGNAIYPSLPELNKTSLGANNELYISIKDKASELGAQTFKEAIDIDKIKTKLGQIKSRIEKNNIDLYQMVEIARKTFDLETLKKA